MRNTQILYYQPLLLFIVIIVKNIFLFYASNIMHPNSLYSGDFEKRFLRLKRNFILILRSGKTQNLEAKTKIFLNFSILKSLFFKSFKIIFIRK